MTIALAGRVQAAIPKLIQSGRRPIHPASSLRSMPRFHFDVRYDDEAWSEDEEENDFASLDEARSEAIELMAGLTANKLREYRRLMIRVRDDQRRPLLTLTLSLKAEE